jgi:hypothetical protein
MGFLKAFVIGMAGLIVIGITVMAWGLAHHWTGLLSRSSTEAAAGPSVAASRAPVAAATTSGTTPVVLTVPAPEGMHFEQMATTDGMVVLRFAGPQGQRIVTVDPRTGQIGATIAVPPGGP